MFDPDDKILKIANAGNNNDEATRQIGTELVQAEYRLSIHLANLRGQLDRIEQTVRRGHETTGITGDLSSLSVVRLVEALGERNTAIRALKRLGVDVSKI